MTAFNVNFIDGSSKIVEGDSLDFASSNFIHIVKEPEKVINADEIQEDKVERVVAIFNPSLIKYITEDHDDSN